MHLHVVYKNIKQNASIYSILKHQLNTDILYKMVLVSLMLFQCHGKS